MSGTLFGLPLSQQWDENGDPLSGSLLYIYEANTSTPVDAFQDFGLTAGLELPFPIEADSAGRLPQFWLADGAYRARLTTSLGIEVFDYASIQALGASSGDVGGGGGGVDAEALFATGDFLWQPITGTRTGWVRANARSIGSASSGATERANADTQTLYEFLWNNFTDALCPVATGRGASAVADFNANKAIGTLDMRGRSMFGLDDMGNSAASVLVTGTPTAAASATGAEKTTVAVANLPVANLSLASLTISVANGTNVAHGTGFDSAAGGSGGGSGITGSPTISTITATPGGTLPLGGSGTAATTISPGRLGTVYIKL